MCLLIVLRVGETSPGVKMGPSFAECGSHVYVTVEAFPVLWNHSWRCVLTRLWAGGHPNGHCEVTWFSTCRQALPVNQLLQAFPAVPGRGDTWTPPARASAGRRARRGPAAASCTSRGGPRSASRWRSRRRAGRWRLPHLLSEPAGKTQRPRLGWGSHNGRTWHMGPGLPLHPLVRKHSWRQTQPKSCLWDRRHPHLAISATSPRTAEDKRLTPHEQSIDNWEMDHPEILHPLLFRHGFTLIQCGVIFKENDGHILCHDLPKSEGEHSGTMKRKEGAEHFPITSFTKQTELWNTCSPGKKACRESIHVFMSCPLNMFTLT